MPVLPFSSDDDVVKFAKAFLDNRVETFRKDIKICLTPLKKENTHAYFPGLITCIAFADFLSGLYAGDIERHSLKDLHKYVVKFLNSVEYTKDRIDVLYECFRHKVAHLAQPYAVFDTNTHSNSNIFAGQRKRLIAWSVHASGPRPAIKIVAEKSRKLIKKAVTPWRVYYDHRVHVRVRSLTSDIVKSIPKYLQHLKNDKQARENFKKCMEVYFPDDTSTARSANET